MNTAADLSQLQTKGISPETLQLQLDNFHNGFPYLNIDRAACIGDGILRLEASRVDELSHLYNKIAYQGLSIEKFTPASGAATRMFKDLFEYLTLDKQNSVVTDTINHIDKFAFCNDLQGAGIDLSNPKALIQAIINEPLNYGKLPKALLKFHCYQDGNRTALEEHLVEGAHYGLTCEKPVAIHFTVSPEHLPLFTALVDNVLEKYQTKFGVTYNITYSTQKSSTDTIAVTPDNQPFRTATGELLFRPSGHGALLDNLADLESDLIFIKTVDNVQPDHRKAETLTYKKVLGALAITLREEIISHIRAIDRGDADPEQVIAFIEKNLGYRFGDSTNFEQLRSILNRPLRVCGMVKNEGEPGGGPFWVKGSDGSQSLQIAESSQISPSQKDLMKGATHFNPVDLVCMPRDINNQKFNLHDFRDPSTGFISEKSYEGCTIKAQELPGLWNGAMANWNTIFVEVPIETFSPVKVVSDLLRVEHQ